jgi:hypothetical protein
MVREFKAQQIYHHTYQLKEERAFRIVIRYLHHSTNIEDIKQELAELGHRVRNIINILHKSTKEPLNLFFVDLEPAPNKKKKKLRHNRSSKQNCKNRTSTLQ